VIQNHVIILDDLWDDFHPEKVGISRRTNGCKLIVTISHSLKKIEVDPECLLNTVEHFLRPCLLPTRRRISQLEAELSGEMPRPVSKIRCLLSTFRFFVFWRKRRFLFRIIPMIANKSLFSISEATCSGYL